MGRVRFHKADPKLPADKGGRRWVHRKGGRAYRGDGSYRLVDPIVFLPNNTYDVTDWEEAWLIQQLPQCFKSAASKKGKSKEPEADSEGEQ